MAKNEVKVSSGFAFGPILFLVFLVLKLTHVIDWSWWWVSSPLWIPVALVLGIVLIGAMIQVGIVGFSVVERRLKNRRR